MTSSGSFLLKSYDWAGGTLECRWSINDRGDNKSDVYAELWGHTTGFRTYGSGYFTFRIGGADGNWTGTVDVSGSWKKLGNWSRTLDHDAAGALSSVDIGVLGGEVYGTSFNSIGYTGLNLEYHAGTDYVVLPNAPYNIAVRAGTVATTSFGVDFWRSSYDYVDTDEVQWALDPGFTNVVWTDNPGGGGNGSQGFSNPAGATPVKQLTPGTTHYVRARSHTGAGWGGYSATVSQVTLPAVPPGLTVASSPSGTQATLTFSPPGGVTGVDHYTYERRTTGTTSPVYSKDSPTTIVTEPGLTPGGSYDWRASAWIGTYQSPWTGWTTLVQAKPNTNPGDYFDGSTPDTVDVSFDWTGAADGSTSVAVASGVDGWGVDTTPAGSAVLYRVTAGLFGTYAARVVFKNDVNQAAQAGAHMGQGWGPASTDVTVGGTYVGSIHVRPHRGQQLAALLIWLNADGTQVVGTSLGTGTNVPADGSWYRLSVTGVAPAGAERAIVRTSDVAGAGWSTWKGGDIVDLDGAMVSLSELFPYFDGDTTDDATYLYDWVDPDLPHSSTSKRTGVAQAKTQSLSNARALLDPNCVPPAPPRPPTIPSDCITEAGIWRRTLAVISSTEISDWLDVVPTFEITTLSQDVSQVRIRIYANPDNLPATLVDTTTWVSEQIVAYVPSNTVLTVDGVHQRVWAEVGDNEAISADHLLYGSNGTPPTWPVLSCGIPYLLSVDLPVEIAQGDSRLHTYLTTRY